MGAVGNNHAQSGDGAEAGGIARGVVGSAAKAVKVFDLQHGRASSTPCEENDIEDSKQRRADKQVLGRRDDVTGNLKKQAGQIAITKEQEKKRRSGQGVG